MGNSIQDSRDWLFTFTQIGLQLYHYAPVTLQAVCPVVRGFTRRRNLISSEIWSFPHTTGGRSGITNGYMPL